MRLQNHHHILLTSFAQPHLVISGFRFVVAGTTVDRVTADRDLARLNEYLIAQRERASILRGKIRDLKANCDKVRTLRDTSMLEPRHIRGIQCSSYLAPRHGSAHRNCIPPLATSTLTINE